MYFQCSIISQQIDRSAIEGVSEVSQGRILRYFLFQADFVWKEGGDGEVTETASRRNSFMKCQLPLTRLPALPCPSCVFLPIHVPSHLPDPNLNDSSDIWAVIVARWPRTVVPLFRFAFSSPEFLLALENGYGQGPRLLSLTTCV